MAMYDTERDPYERRRSAGELGGDYTSAYQASEPATQVWESPSTPEPRAGESGYQTPPPPPSSPYQNDWSYEGSPAYTPPAPTQAAPSPYQPPPATPVQAQFSQVAKNYPPTQEGYAQLMQDPKFQQLGIQSVGNGALRLSTGEMINAMQTFPSGGQAWQWGGASTPKAQTGASNPWANFVQAAQQMQQTQQQEYAQQQQAYQQQLQQWQQAQQPPQTNPWAQMAQQVGGMAGSFLQQPPQAPPQGAPWAQAIQGVQGAMGQWGQPQQAPPQGNPWFTGLTEAQTNLPSMFDNLAGGPPTAWTGGSPSFNEQTGQMGAYQGGGVKNLPGPAQMAPGTPPPVAWGGPDNPARYGPFIDWSSYQGPYSQLQGGAPQPPPAEQILNYLAQGMPSPYQYG